MGTVKVVDPNLIRKVLSILLKVVTMDGNWVIHPNDKTLSFADGHINADWRPITHCFVAGIGPEIPWIFVTVGVRGAEFVPSSQESSVKMWRLAPESRTQRSDWEPVVRDVITLICVSFSSSVSLISGWKAMVWLEELVGLSVGVANTESLLDDVWEKERL